MVRTKPWQPSTSPEPVLRTLFDEQSRREIPIREFARLTHIADGTLANLRHPNGGDGKWPKIHHLRKIAAALGYSVQITLVRK